MPCNLTIHRARVKQRGSFKIKRIMSGSQVLLSSRVIQVFYFYVALNRLPMYQIGYLCCQQFYGTVASDRVFKFGYLISKMEVRKKIKILSI